MLVLEVGGMARQACAGKGEGMLKLHRSVTKVEDERQGRGAGEVGHRAVEGPKLSLAPCFPFLVLFCSSSGMLRAVLAMQFSRAQYHAAKSLALAWIKQPQTADELPDLSRLTYCCCTCDVPTGLWLQHCPVVPTQPQNCCEKKDIFKVQVWQVLS